MDEAGVGWIRVLPTRGYEALTILTDGTVFLTPGFNG